MGREIKRVPMDFDFPLDQTWTGYLTPDELVDEIPCPEDCSGWSARARYLKERWYGNVPFSPEENGSTPFTGSNPVIEKRAAWDIERSPEFYGTDPYAVSRRANWLANHFNKSWMHHLSQDEVDFLLADGQLRDFTHTWTRESGWQKIEPPVHPTAAQVNEWSLTGFGHSSAYYVLIKAQCEREGTSDECQTCDGQGSFERYKGQRDDAEKWERTSPPKGEGWQLWQTVSEGGPISPVFATAEELAQWMTTPAYNWGASKGEEISYENALAFVNAGWAPSFVATPQHGVETGEQVIGREALEKGGDA